ncbi:MAG TPA: L,D-transpeptidase [Methylophilaceae bacterium]|nr:L,D-transpeptidase [Methylophilaceae bacterium]
MHIEISIANQQLHLLNEQGEVLVSYPVSTALKGAGEVKNSFCTPRGRHIIRAKIGKDVPINTVFKGRRPTGEFWSPELSAQQPGRDWILTRILWLSGCEPGFNRLGNVDSMQRYIYIHGTPDIEPMGQPGSHGCVRMRNSDVIALFDLVPVGTSVRITDA